MALNDIVGGFIKESGIIEGPNYRSIGFVDQNGWISEFNYKGPIGRIDSGNCVRGDYDMRTGIQVNAATRMIDRNY